MGSNRRLVALLLPLLVACGSDSSTTDGGGDATIDVQAQDVAVQDVAVQDVAVMDSGADVGTSLTGVFVASGGAKTQGGVTLNGRFHWQGTAMTATNGNVTLTGWFR